MANTDAFALQQSGFNAFLFPLVGTEPNGMTLSLVSVFARAGNDPWLEAGRLAGSSKSEATESLARSIAGMPTSMWHVASDVDVWRFAISGMVQPVSPSGRW
jgi:hypothetical protein